VTSQTQRLVVIRQIELRGMAINTIKLAERWRYTNRTKGSNLKGKELSYTRRYDNTPAPAHRAVTTNEFLAKHNIPWLSHPPYSPDLAPCDFFLFPQLKKTMKDRRFHYIEEIQGNARRKLRATTKSDHQRCFRQRQERWNKCTQAQGHFFKGDKTN